MAIKATIRTMTVPTVKVEVAPSGSLQMPGGSTGLTLKQQQAAEFSRLDQLLDVIEPPNAPENSVLVYHPDTDKYVVQELNLDGGTF